MLASAVLVLAVAVSQHAVGSLAEPFSDFRCNKAAFYPTAGAFSSKPGGTRHGESRSWPMLARSATAIIRVTAVIIGTRTKLNVTRMSQ
jgi:hypothetical protein